jgi:hypothetical protein
MTSDSRNSGDVLARARQAWSPSAADGERVRRAIGAAVAVGAPPSVPVPPLRAARWGTRLLAAGTLAAASGGIGYWAGHRAGVRDASPVALVAPSAPPLALGVRSAPPAPPVEAPSLAALPPTATHHGGHLARHEAETSPPATESLATELRALRNAERALRDGNPGLTLAFLADLDRQVPQGQLTEERAAMATLARCARGDRPIGVDLGADFIERYPASVYRARVEQVCPTTDSPRTGDSRQRRSSE